MSNNKQENNGRVCNLQESNVRPNKLFTADRSIVLYKAGALKEFKTEQILDEVIKILSKNE